MINQNIAGYDLNSRNMGFKADAIPGIQLNNNQTQEGTALPDVELPDMYYMPENYKRPKTFVDGIKKIDLLGLVHPWFEHPLLMIATCTGLSLGVDAFDKSCNKEYEKSIVGRAAKFGDKIENSKFVQNDTTKGILSGIKKGWQKVKTIAMKNNVINAMVTTPSEPEWAIPKDELKHTDYRIVTKFKELASEFNLVPGIESQNGPKAKEFMVKDLALNKTEIEGLKQLYNVDKISQIPEEEVVNRIMLQRLGKSENEIKSIIQKSNASDIVTKEIFKKSGLTSAQLDAIFKDETGETFELVKNASGNLKGTRLAHGKIVIPGPRQPFANIEGFEGIYNRAHSLSDGAATKTGRFMSKLVQKIYRGFTFGNQKQAVLIWVTPFLASSIISTIRADKNEKVGTAISGFINTFSWVFTFPLALRGIHAFGGMQYAGMGKEKVDEYKKLVHEFNDKVNARGFSNISEYRTAKKDLKKQLKDLRKVKNENFLTMALRGISKFSKADLLKLESYRSPSGSGDFLRKLPNLLKDYVIYAPGRMLVFMFVGIAFADKIIDKTLSLIFGKPYDSYKDDELKDAKNKQEEFSINDLRTRLVDLQRDKLYPQQQENIANSEQTVKNISAAYIPGKMAALAERGELNQEHKSVLVEETEPEATDELQNMPVFEEENLTDAENEIPELKEENQRSVSENIIDNNKPEEILPAQENQINDNKIEETPQNTLAEPNLEERLPLVADAEFEEVNEVKPMAGYNIEDAEFEEMPEENLMPELEIYKPLEEMNKANNPADNNAHQGEKNNDIAQNVSPTYIQQTKPAKKLQQNLLPQKRDNYTYIPSQENIINQLNPTTPVNKYIPSQIGLQLNKTFDNSGLEAALRRADRAEKRALDVLAGNFGNL